MKAKASFRKRRAKRRRIALATIDPSMVRRHYLRGTYKERAVFALASTGLPAHRRRGAWDKRCIDVEAHPTYELLSVLYATNFDPSQTARFRELMERVQENRPVRKRGRLLDSEAAVREHFKKYTDLFESIERRGYKPGYAKDEISIAIARDGELIKVANGNHRFAIAKLLGLREIVAEIRFVHEGWYRSFLRESEATRLEDAIGSLPGVVRIHP